MRLDYDDYADVLYVIFDESLRSCIYVDSPSGAILRVDEASGKIASASIPFFSRRAKLGDLNFPELNGEFLPEGFLKTLQV